MFVLLHIQKHIPRTILYQYQVLCLSSHRNYIFQYYPSSSHILFICYVFLIADKAGKQCLSNLCYFSSTNNTGLPRVIFACFQKFFFYGVIRSHNLLPPQHLHDSHTFVSAFLLIHTHLIIRQAFVLFLDE